MDKKWYRIFIKSEELNDITKLRILQYHLRWVKSFSESEIYNTIGERETLIGGTEYYFFTDANMERTITEFEDKLKESEPPKIKEQYLTKQ